MSQLPVPRKRLSPRADLQPADAEFRVYAQYLYSARETALRALRNGDALHANVAMHAVKAAGLQMVRYVLRCDRSHLS